MKSLDRRLVSSSMTMRMSLYLFSSSSLNSTTRFPVTEHKPLTASWCTLKHTQLEIKRKNVCVKWINLNKHLHWNNTVLHTLTVSHTYTHMQTNKSLSLSLSLSHTHTHTHTHTHHIHTYIHTQSLRFLITELRTTHSTHFINSYIGIRKIHRSLREDRSRTGPASDRPPSRPWPTLTWVVFGIHLDDWQTEIIEFLRLGLKLKKPVSNLTSHHHLYSSIKVAGLSDFRRYADI